MTRYSAVIDKKYYEFKMEEKLAVGDGFVFDGGHYGINGMVRDDANGAYHMVLSH